MSIAILSLLVIASSAVVLALLERRYPHTLGQRSFRRGFWLDFVVYGMLQSWVLGVAIGAAISALDDATGTGRLGLIRGWPIWAQLLLFVVTHDLYIYCFHRLQHTSPLLWRVHEAHHSNKEIDWVAGARSHPVEILINQTIEWLPMVLLGASPEVPVLKATVSAVWGNFIHSNVNVSLGPLKWLFNGPELHRWHHAAELGFPGANFATKLAIWDYLFGTAYAPAAKKPVSYGLGDEPYPDYVGVAPAEAAVGTGAAGAIGAVRDTLEVYAAQVRAAFRPFPAVSPVAAPVETPASEERAHGGTGR